MQGSRYASALWFCLFALCAATFNANASNNSATHNVTITWGAVGELTVYRLERRPIDAQNVPGAWGLVEDVPGFTYSDSVADGKYEYRVSACISRHDDTSITLCNDASQGIDIADYSSNAPFDTANPVPFLETPWADLGINNIQPVAAADPETPNSDFNGAIPGQAGVSGGAGTYNLPIVVPPGRNGVQPNVSLSYSSRSGNGIAGVGWSLSAGSAISRCPPTLAQDGKTDRIRFDSSDRLCLDGQRLVPESSSATYGDSGTVYRTEIDSFVRVFQNNSLSNTTFTVVLPNGTTRSYGNGTDSRVTPTGKSTALSWLIDREEDVSGTNHMSFEYQDYGDGEVLLKRILYTGNGITDGNRKVVFGYEARNDTSTQYLGGGKTRTTQRLGQISTFYGTSEIRRYDLNHLYSGASGRTLLSSVQECADPTGTNQCRALTAFNWSDDPHNFQVELLQTNSGTEIFPTVTDLNGNPVNSGLIAASGDMNGDGVRDWRGRTSFNGDPRVIFMNAEADQLDINSEALVECLHSSVTFNPVCIDADFDLDGRGDSWTANSNDKLEIWYSRGSNTDFSYSPTGTTDVTIADSGNTTAYHYQIVSTADFNGDAWPDIILKRSSGAGAGLYTAELFLYSHTGDTANPYRQSDQQLIGTFGNSSNNTGTTIEVVGDMNGDGLPDLTVSNKLVNQVNLVLSELLISQYNPTTQQLSFNSFDINFANVDETTEGHFSYLMDVNGDGLNDWLGWLNYVDSTNPGNVMVKLNKGDGTFDTAIDSGYQIGAVVLDFPGNDNGVSERYGAALVSQFRVMDVNSDGRTELLIPSGNIVAEYCHDVQIYQQGQWQRVERCGNALRGTYLDEQQQQRPLPPEVDRSVRTYNALYFDENESTLTATLRATELVGNGSSSLVVDSLGKGLPDLVFEHGCVESSWCENKPGLAGSAMEGKAANKVYYNRNYGSATGTLDETSYYPVDMLLQADNGVGIVSEWYHRPLSSGDSDYEVDFESLPLYDKHIHFSSSMYTVRSFSQSNGLKDQKNTREYGYEAALYNLEGRGFRGFLKITELAKSSDTDDKPTFTETKFKQLFPRSSLVEEQNVYEASQTTPFRIVTNDWRFNPAHNFTGIYHLFNHQSVSTVKDISTFATVSTTTTMVGTDGTDGIDEFGNILKKTTSITDDYGTYTTEEKGDYAEVTSTWMNRYESRTVTRQKVARTSEGLTDTTELDKDKIVHTEVTWNTDYRKPHTVKVYAAEESLTVNEDSLFTTTTTTYNDHGLPKSVSVVGDVIENAADTAASQTRTTSTTYTKNGTTESDEGYFPLVINQDLAHVTTTNTDPKTGLPTYVKDVAGVETTTTYDDLARPVSIKRTGFPVQKIGYIADTSYTAGNSVMRIITKQAGVPDTAELKDPLGRTVRTTTVGFDGTLIYQDTSYNGRGLTVTESTPHKGTAANTVYSDFDVLGRPGQKVTPQTNGKLTTQYVYSGLKTTIDVTATVGSNITNMHRIYNALEQLVETQDAAGNKTQYAYDGAGNPIIIKDANNHSIVAKYDALGRKEYVDDPNMGKTVFTYNDFGELEKEKDANNDFIRYDMDLLGRVTKRLVNTDTAQTANFLWDTEKKGLLTSQSTSGSAKAYQYDSAARITETKVTIDGTDYVTTTGYDTNHGRPLTMTYPVSAGETEGLAIAYEYNSHGYLTKEINAQSLHVYREVKEQDAFGNIQKAEMNEGGLTGTYLYHGRSGQMLSSVVNGADGDKQNIIYFDEQNFKTGYDSYGNLTHHKNMISGAEDIFTYDILHRLTQSEVKYGGASSFIYYGYDKVGNMLKKSDYSIDSDTAYQYNADNNQLETITLKDTVYQKYGYDDADLTFAYDAKGNLTHRDNKHEVTYNAFNKPTTIKKDGSDIVLSYGADLARFKQVRQEKDENNATIEVTTYYIDKHFEVEVYPENTASKHYISDVAIVTLNTNKNDAIVFTHRDRLGSATTMTDANNAVVARRHFDPFGKPREGSNWTLLEDLGFFPRLSENPSDPIMATRKGFTDHEHLDEAELIHMNGRVYDYNVGRFMSVDPVIQAPTNTQSINPYSYIMNNPLAGTDPTGYTGQCPSEGGECPTVTVSESTEKVAVTGSRIKRKQTTRTTTSEDGTVTTRTIASSADGFFGTQTVVRPQNTGGNSADLGNQDGIAKTIVKQDLKTSNKPVSEKVVVNANSTLEELRQIPEIQELEKEFGVVTLTFDNGKTVGIIGNTININEDIFSIGYKVDVDSTINAYYELYADLDNNEFDRRITAAENSVNNLEEFQRFTMRRVLVHEIMHLKQGHVDDMEYFINRELYEKTNIRRTNELLFKHYKEPFRVKNHGAAKTLD